MAAKGGTALAVVVYTLLRVALFAVVWVGFELVTPIHGLWAAVSALLISGAISVVVLDGPRGKVGVAAGRFFGRINERIEASASAEDEADGEPLTSGESEQQTQRNPVAEQ